MDPSPAERFHFEYEHQQQAWALQQQAWAWQQAQAARLNAASSAQIADRISGAAQIVSQEGAHMYYEERTFDIGDLEIGAEQRPTFKLPGDFGTALSFVATVSNDGCAKSSYARFLWMSFQTSVDGEHWLSIHAPGLHSFFVGESGGAASTRQHGPFGNRLALKFGCKYSNELNDSWTAGKWYDLRLSIGVQRI